MTDQQATDQHRERAKQPWRRHPATRGRGISSGLSSATLRARRARHLNFSRSEGVQGSSSASWQYAEGGAKRRRLDAGGVERRGGARLAPGGQAVVDLTSGDARPSAPELLSSEDRAWFARVLVDASAAASQPLAQINGVNNAWHIRTLMTAPANAFFSAGEVPFGDLESTRFLWRLARAGHCDGTKTSAHTVAAAAAASLYLPPRAQTSGLRLPLAAPDTWHRVLEPIPGCYPNRSSPLSLLGAGHCTATANNSRTIMPGSSFPCFSSCWTIPGGGLTPRWDMQSCSGGTKP